MPFDKQETQTWISESISKLARNAILDDDVADSICSEGFERAALAGYGEVAHLFDACRKERFGVAAFAIVRITGIDPRRRPLIDALSRFARELAGWSEEANDGYTRLVKAVRQISDAKPLELLFAQVAKGPTDATANPGQGDNQDPQSRVGIELPVSSHDPNQQEQRKPSRAGFALTPLDGDILIALMRQNAFEKGRHLSSTRLAGFIGGDCSADSIKQHGPKLIKFGLVKSVKNSTGGYFLTTNGKREAERINRQRKKGSR
ncbi:MAG: hypothetical protein K1X57_19025 [Gemmataceae bacterium]|nr:hypothetical protein [Gemmataceae bacterium]